MLLALAFAVDISAQSLATEQEPAPKSSPAKPEARSALSIDPDALFPHLLSGDSSTRRAAFERFGMDRIAEQNPQDIRLLALNIDSDRDLERIVIANSDLQTEVIVLKREGGIWWKLSHFVCCGFGSTLELRSTVWPGTNDIILHSEGGTGDWCWGNPPADIPNMAGRPIPSIGYC